MYFNSAGETVGSIQRYYKSIFHSALDMFAGSFSLIVSFRAFDATGVPILNAVRKNHAVGKPDYYIEFLEGELKGTKFHARQQNTFDIFNAEFLIKGNGIEISTQKALLEWVRFYENDKEVARWRCMLKEKFKTYIEIEEAATIQTPVFYGLLGQMLYIVGE